MVQCPHCNQPVTADAPGLQSGERRDLTCASCRKPFEVYEFRREYQAVVAERVAETEGACAGHPNNRASAVCERCGDFMCSLCRTDVEGRSYCPKCFDLLFTRGALESSQRAFATPKFALNAAIVALLLGWVQCAGLVLGPIAIYLAVRSLNEIKLRPELPGRNHAIAALCIGIVATLVSAVLMVLLAFGMAFLGP